MFIYSQYDSIGEDKWRKLVVLSAARTLADARQVCADSGNWAG